jgi:hypothetical protein
MQSRMVYAASTDVYVSVTGNDASACTSSAPCRTIQKGMNVVQPGGTVHIQAGTYSESVSISKVATQAQPIRILGENAILSNGGTGAFIVSNSQWIIFEGLTIKGYTLSDFQIRQSHYLTFKNNILQFKFAAVRILDDVSHVLVENNEMYQTYPVGSTWSFLKGSEYEGAGIYATTGGQGMYIIRGNYFHDSMNGVYISDDGVGQWMNANIFISGNTFRNIVDDPFEPEGDSFNLHFYNNSLINTHRMASIVPDAACIGPIFVYGNYQHDTIDPTGEASIGRKNSAIKMDMSIGTCPNGVWVFNNTINANALGTNFYGVHLITPSVKNYTMLNNVLITEKNAYSGTAVFTNAISDYNISLMPFGDVEPHSLQADPLLDLNGTLQSTSPAKGRGTSVEITNYFASSDIVPAGADLGAFRGFPLPHYVLPPGGEPVDFPANVAGWPDVLPPVAATSTPTVAPTGSATQLPTLTNVPVSTTVVTMTQISLPPTSTSTAVPTLPLPTSTPTAVPTFTSTSVPPSPTFTAVPTYDSLPQAETIYNDTNPALNYSANWQEVRSGRAYEGSFKSTGTVGSLVTLSFIGRSFGLLYSTGRVFGKLEIYIDNQLITTLDQKASKNEFQKRWDYQGMLSPGAHQLKLIFIGPENLRGSIDAIIVR